jgi:hypothetical protein
VTISLEGSVVFQLVIENYLSYLLRDASVLMFKRAGLAFANHANGKFKSLVPECLEATIAGKTLPPHLDGKGAGSNDNSEKEEEEEEEEEEGGGEEVDRDEMTYATLISPQLDLAEEDLRFAMSIHPVQLL